MSEPALYNSGSIVWEPDSATNHCRGCKQEFSLFKRRHHCRNCGKLFCNECTKYRSAPPLVVPKPLRTDRLSRNPSRIPSLPDVVGDKPVRSAKSSTPSVHSEKLKPQGLSSKSSTAGFKGERLCKLCKEEEERSRAEIGDAQAQLSLGFRLLKEHEIPKDKRGRSYTAGTLAPGEERSVKYDEINNQLHKLYEEDTEAVLWLREASMNGVGFAQSKLAECLEKGIGCKINIEEAMFWFQAAADKGDPHAMYRIGRKYEFGEGVEADLKKAFKWYTASAKEDYAPALHSLGCMYETGKGLERRDYEKAVKCFRFAAEQGHAGGQYKLGTLYERGRGIEKNEESALIWYTKAADQGHRDAMSNIARIGQYRSSMRE